MLLVGGLAAWCVACRAPALRHPWLARHTNPEALVTQGAVSMIDIGLGFSAAFSF